MSLIQKLQMSLRSCVLFCQGTDVAKTDITISFATANGCLEGSLTYAADALQRATAEAMASFLQVILSHSATEQQARLCHDADDGYPHVQILGSMLHAFSKQPLYATHLPRY